MKINGQNGLASLVYTTLGGLLPTNKLQACMDWCASLEGRPVPIGALIALAAGTCRHRAFLFFHLARRLGLRVEFYRGSVDDSRHAWNVVRIGDERVFVDTTLGVVLDNARDAEEAYGYHASRHDRLSPEATPLAVHVVTGEGDEARIEPVHVRYEIRKVPGDEEAVLLLYPKGEMPEVRYLHVHLRIEPSVTTMFAIDPFISARLYAIVGDEAHYRMDALERDVLAAIRRAWPKDQA